MQKDHFKKQELMQVLQEGEGQFVEFKEKADNSLTKEIVAFANASGGRIKPLSTHFFVEMESKEKSLSDSGLKDGIKDGKKDGLRDGIKLSKNQEEILSLVLEDENITQEALAEKVGISIRNVEKRIADLKEKGILQRIGSRKSGCWEIDMESLKNISGDGIKDGKKDGIKAR